VFEKSKTYYQFYFKDFEGVTMRAFGTLEFETFPDLKIPLDAVFSDWV
jgi:hypothetical protein